MKPKKSWRKPRHRIITAIVCAIIRPYCKIRYGADIQKFHNDPNRTYLILLNHQTPFDQFFVACSFKGPIYYLATEDLFSNGWVSRLITWLAAPIPIKKQTTDIMAIKTCLKVAAEGGTLCIAPEGNRTYSGKTEYMRPAIASLAKKLGLPIVLYRIEGGYGAEPRWSDVVRKGKLTAYVSRVIEPEEYKGLTNDELFALIQEGLYVNEAVADGVFTHKKRAEYLERAVYVCPFCGLSRFESHNEFIRCTGCGRKIEYLPTKELSGVGFSFPFRFVNDWYEYQKDFVRKLDLTGYLETPMYLDNVRLSEVILRKRKHLLQENAEVRLFGNRIEIGEDLVLQFNDCSAVTVLGRNKLNIYHGSKVYQFKGSKRFNALKYVNIFHHYKNIHRGDGNDEFLGL